MLPLSGARYQETPKRAANFVDSVGTVVSSGNLSNATVGPLASALAASGIRHVRIGVIKDDPTYDRVVTSFLSQSGATALGTTLCSPPLNGSGQTGITAADIRNFSAAIGGRLDSYETMNEPDEFKNSDTAWVADLRRCMQSQQGALPGKLFVGPALVDEVHDAPALGDLSATIDADNMHRYFAGRSPDAPGWGSTNTCGKYGALDWALCEARIPAPTKPLIITETGYNSVTEVDELAQGKYLTRALLVNSNHGVLRSFIYCFVSYTNGDSFGGDGLLAPNFAPKPAYRAIQTLLSAFSGSSSGATPTTTTAYITASPTIDHAIFQNADGSYVLALWNETASWDQVAHKRISVAATTVTVALPFNLSISTSTVISDSGSGARANVTPARNGFSVPIDDHVTLITFARS